MTVTTALDTIKDKVAALAAPEASLQDIGNQLGYLWDQAEKSGDLIAQNYLSAAWERTQALGATTSAANAVATAALETAVEMAEMAAKTQGELVELQESLPDIVQDAYSEGASDAEDGIFEALVNGYNGELYMQDPPDEIISILTFELRRGHHEGEKATDICSYDDAEAFALYIGGHTPPMGSDLARQVCEFLRDFGAEYRRIIEIQTEEMIRNREILMRRLDEADPAGSRRAAAG